DGGGRALDVGCGAGQLVVGLAAQGWAATGCDLALLQVDAAHRRLAAADRPPSVLQADGEGLPFADASFAAVTALGYIEYLPDLARALAEMARVTAPGGRVVVTAPNRLRLNYLADPVGVLRGYLSPNHRGYHRHYLTRLSLERLIRAAGLRPEVVDGHGLGGFTLAGFPLLAPARAIALDGRLQRRLPAAVSAALGADLVALAVKPG
ncbi:MAG: class I SAM-dependent methyltransferase, partial [Acidimicrobiales bacterium]